MRSTFFLSILILAANRDTLASAASARIQPDKTGDAYNETISLSPIPSLSPMPTAELTEDRFALVYGNNGLLGFADPPTAEPTAVPSEVKIAVPTSALTLSAAPSKAKSSTPTSALNEDLTDSPSTTPGKDTNIVPSPVSPVTPIEGSTVLPNLPNETIVPSKTEEPTFELDQCFHIKMNIESDNSTRPSKISSIIHTKMLSQYSITFFEKTVTQFLNAILLKSTTDSLFTITAVIVSPFEDNLAVKKGERDESAEIGLRVHKAQMAWLESTGSFDTNRGRQHNEKSSLPPSVMQVLNSTKTLDFYTTIHGGYVDPYSSSSNPEVDVKIFTSIISNAFVDQVGTFLIELKKEEAFEHAFAVDITTLSSPSFDNNSSDGDGDRIIIGGGGGGGNPPFPPPRQQPKDGPQPRNGKVGIILGVAFGSLFTVLCTALVVRKIISDRAPRRQISALENTPVAVSLYDHDVGKFPTSAEDFLTYSSRNARFSLADELCPPPGTQVFFLPTSTSLSRAGDSETAVEGDSQSESE
eukprot:CAMPEP_0195529948 /NCGR_PEP_ID=MMETSP0794_2-20130614/32621_1 /TAXON_ID=515487 /ORGANISM="Stephanopyxis turris, Strain CCMP 815" /LENGTH=526 /DNA_ID=CAMNT_0040661333 /DNA_START=92 /DNA_END=1672 /DNA_ORIENTATION=+